jgi:hypothetical protein
VRKRACIKRNLSILVNFYSNCGNLGSMFSSQMRGKQSNVSVDVASRYCDMMAESQNSGANICGHC